MRVGPNNSMGVVAEPYYRLPATTKAAKKVAAMLLETTVSILPRVDSLSFPGVLLTMSLPTIY